MFQSLKTFCGSQDPMLPSPCCSFDLLLNVFERWIALAMINLRILLSLLLSIVTSYLSFTIELKQFFVLFSVSINSPLFLLINTTVDGTKLPTEWENLIDCLKYAIFFPLNVLSYIVRHFLARLSCFQPQLNAATILCVPHHIIYVAY